MTVNVPDRRGRRVPSPLEGERIRPLSRRQIEDRLGELGDLYAATSGGDPRAWNQGRELFLRRLVGEVPRPGFALLVAESDMLPEPAGAAGATGAEVPTAHEEGVVLTGCAYGFPVLADGPWWWGPDGCLPRELLRLAASGRLFAIPGILVHSWVRTQNQGCDWNLARRLQRRLLAGHTAVLADHPAVLGVTLVDRGDTVTLRALRSWGWRSVAADARTATPTARCRALVIGP
ncbi:hypothetical protein IM697_24950 [Streptomyces ferrugineus]|uniref:Uncharacterized protein n=1 Tax=Streptomyces ferrugineus TaxID=1413221 RepID=A0A7M2SD86_9ACTN|nr:hypothetical protein [Streptomyces ferrugineus]QOV33458.1 hypothetical protein IM697_24950 [Streptomyces ferrugineus]